MKEHLRLAAAIAAAGFIFTSRPWLRFINRLSPEAGLLVKNVIIFSTVLGLHYVDGLVGTPHRQALGILLVYTAVSMIFNYQSRWINEAGAENVEKQTPDGAMYERARSLFSPEVSRLVTFVLVPFILILVGSKFVSKRVELD
jgi:hypothetical protein